MASREGRPWRAPLLGLGGAVLLLAAAGVHLDLYLTGYRNIPTIGPLFLVQVASAVIVAVAVAVVVIGRSRALTALVAAAGAAFALGTVAAYGVSRASSLFGFHEHPSTAGLVAGLLEVGAFIPLGLLAGQAWGERLRPVSPTAPPGVGGDRGDRATAPGHRRGRSLGLGAATAVLLALVLATGIGSPASPAPSSHSATSAIPPGPVVRVVISNYAFQPSRVVVRPGESIAVTNKDQVVHTMTAVPASAPFGAFNTGSVDPGQTVRIDAPKAAGKYDFYCSIHPFMRGVLVVSG